MAPQRAKPGRQRRVDPERRDRIARAALAVVTERGVEALTHRAAAKAADVPLGSTTYHFDDREELLLAALELALAGNRETIDAWLAELPAEPDLPRALTDLVLGGAEDRESAVVGYDLYVAALRHPTLRERAVEWSRLLPEKLAPYTDEATALALTVGVEALILRGLIEGAPLEREPIETVLRRIAE